MTCRDITGQAVPKVSTKNTDRIGCLLYNQTLQPGDITHTGTDPEREYPPLLEEDFENHNY
jgi:hypothetical protein